MVDPISLHSRRLAKALKPTDITAIAAALNIRERDLLVDYWLNVSNRDQGRVGQALRDIRSTRTLFKLPNTDRFRAPRTRQELCLACWRARRFAPQAHRHQAVTVPLRACLTNRVKPGNVIRCDPVANHHARQRRDPDWNGVMAADVQILSRIENAIKFQP